MLINMTKTQINKIIKASEKTGKEIVISYSYRNEKGSWQSESQSVADFKEYFVNYDFNYFVQDIKLSGEEWNSYKWINS